MTAGHTTRAERMALPLARTVVKDLAAEHGACLRPVQLRRTDIDTGHVEQVLIPVSAWAKAALGAKPGLSLQEHSCLRHHEVLVGGDVLVDRIHRTRLGGRLLIRFYIVSMLISPRGVAA